MKALYILAIVLALLCSMGFAIAIDSAQGAATQQSIEAAQKTAPPSEAAKPAPAPAIVPSPTPVVISPKVGPSLVSTPPKVEPAPKPAPSIAPRTTPSPLPPVKQETSLPSAAASSGDGKVKSPPPNGTNYSVVVIPASATLSVGQTQQFTAYLYVNGELSSDVPFTWSETGGVGTVDQNGLFTATAAGSGEVRASYTAAGATLYAVAPVIVNGGSPPANNSTYLEILPASATLAIGQLQVFIVYLHANGQALPLPGSLFEWNATGGIGTVSAGGAFTATQAGSGTVSATLINNTQPPLVAYVTVMNSSSNNSSWQIDSIEIAPSSAALAVGQTQQFSLLGFDSNSGTLVAIPNSDVSWSLNGSAGTIDANGLFTATAPGGSTVVATYITNPLLPQATANVSVSDSPPQPPPSGGGSNGGGSSGGSSGGNSGGGAYKSSTSVSTTCAGKAGTISVTVFDRTLKSALVEIFYLGGGKENVLSKTVVSSATTSFTPEKVGSYEVRVSVGVDQSSSYFTVPLCGGKAENVTQVTTVQLSPERELVLSRTVNYLNGFVKKFDVWRERSGVTDSYSTEVTLSYTANQSVENATVLDGAPKSVLSSSGMISFAKRPARFVDGSNDFQWDVASLSSGQKLSYFYSFPRAVTEQMIDSFPAPKLLYARQGGEGAGADGSGSLLAASLVVAGITIPLYVALIASLLLVALAALLIFGRKKGEG